jgi:hypothetical protein
MAAAIEGRRKYSVLRNFTAIRVNQTERLAANARIIRAGCEVWCDVEYWQGKTWEGRTDIVQFTIGGLRYVVSGIEFLSATKLADTNLATHPRRSYENGPRSG